MFGLVLIFVFIVAPLFVHAAPIVPCGTEKELITSAGGTQYERIKNPCQFNHFLVGINNVINFLIMITGSVAAIMFAYAGILVLTAGGGDEGKVKQAKQISWSVVKGLALMLAAWLLVKMVLAGLGLKAGFSLLE